MQGQGSELNEQPSSSQAYGASDTIEAAYSPPSYGGNIDNTFPGPLPAEPNENYWIMDDLWSMQLLNGD